TDRDRTAPLQPDSPAYVIYTSGSTGKPKGVVGLCAGAVNRLKWVQGIYSLTKNSLLARSSIGFLDGSTEILGTLIAGRGIVVASPLEVKSPPDLVRLIAKHKNGSITVVPSLLTTLLEAAEPSDLSSCLFCVTSGEKIPAPLTAEFRQLLPQAQLFNFYGASEASGDSLFAEVSQVAAGDQIPIGRPI
ncbi:AMP-binding protein, partial [Agrobacterium tumefaciens]|uniref:AMP-binding protein n=1 Tax=Agrobacterium tumefaciens TaxID=358 RepID=UPI001146EB51